MNFGKCKDRLKDYLKSKGAIHGADEKITRAMNQASTQEAVLNKSVATPLMETKYSSMNV
jgi:hypothetical protein